MLRSPKMGGKVVATLLEIEEKDTPYRTFCAWLGRYKEESTTTKKPKVLNVQETLQ